MEVQLKYLWSIVLALIIGFGSLRAQIPVQLSQTIETYEGRAFYLHTVEAQQTLYSIAKAYGVTVETILLNNADARRGLRVNQVIRIPVSGTSPTQPQAQTRTPSQTPANEAGEFEYIYHVAGKNETFSYVASVYKVPERRIRDANPNRNEPFREGDYILIPILRKDKRPPVTEAAQLRRSGFDPYDTPSQQSGPSRRDLVNAANTSSTTLPESTNTPTKPQATAVNTSSQAQRQSSPAQPTTRQSAPVMPVETKAEQAANPTNLPVRHIVRPQETLYSIARQYNLSTKQLQQANPGLSENIQVGQVLLLPQNSQQQDVQQEGNQDNIEVVVHTVARGETLFRISRNYGVTIEELKRINPGLSENLSTGQKIKVPKKKITQSYLLHQVDRQQKTKQLVKDYGLTVEEFQKANPSIGKNVFPKQEVKIPLNTMPETASKSFAKGQEPLMPAPQKQKEKEAFPEAVSNGELIDESTENCLPDPLKFNEVYRVALLIPLYLTEVTTANRFTGRSAPADAPRGLSFLHFYQGFLMAADSLAAHFGLRVELLVLDVNQSQESVRQALADPRLRQSNLIIGPFFGQAFDQAASFALANQIPIVNPVTLRRQVVEGNPMVIKLRPDQSSLFDQLAHVLTQTYPDAGVLVMYAPGRNQQEARQLTESFDKVIRQRPRVSNADLIRTLSSRSSGPAFIQYGNTYIDLADLRARPNDSTPLERKVERMAFDRNDLGRFRELADSWRNNVVVVYSDDRAYAMDVLNKLNQVADEYTIQLVGLPDWRRFDNLFIEHMVRLNLHLTDASFVNYDDLKVQFFISQFRDRFGIEPNSYAFEGFDTGWYFLQLLQRKGAQFLPCLPHFTTWQMTNTMRFDRQDENNGFENINWNISRIRNYRFEPLQINQ
jgi:LysM repeat protein